MAAVAAVFLLQAPIGRAAASDIAGDPGRPSRSEPAQPASMDAELSELCDAPSEIPGLGSAPGSSIPCPADVVTEDPMNACLLSGVPDLCRRGLRSSEASDAPADAEPAPGEPAGSGMWTTVGSPNASSEPNYLTGMTCLTSTDCWGVGRSSSGLAQTLTMHWDGSSWKTVPSPGVPSARAHILSDVSCTSSSECWAVGSYISAAFRVHSLIMRWDGATWDIVTSPDIGPTPWNGFNSVACVSESECWAAGFTTDTTAETLIARWDGNTWEVFDSPNASAGSNVLNGLSCTSASDCWAVGSHSPDGVAKLSLVLHWDGGAWEVAPSADPQDAQESVLSGVTCVSDSDCWAVGHSYNGLFRQTLIEHWDGGAWSVVSSPNAIGPLDTYLSRVACASATECWAVGHSDDTATIDQRFIARWDGTAWTPGLLPDLLGERANLLSDVACPNESDCWAVGSFGESGHIRALLTRWDGISWATVDPPTVSLPEESHGYFRDVTCLSDTDCWAVGFYFSGNVARSLVAHWDGTSWDIVSSPNTAIDRNNYLGSVTCVSESDCWAVGRSATTLGTEAQSLALHWDGTSWSIFESSPADTSAVQSNAFEGVSCLSSSDCWAVGHSKIDSRYYAHIKHWDGTSWVPIVAPHKGLPTQSDILYDVVCVTTSDCTAVGAQWTGTAYQTLTERWDGTRWTVVESPNVSTERDNILSGVECVSATECWAVGSTDNYKQALIERWDGSSWSVADAPQTGFNLSAVTCVSATDCWAVGPGFTPTAPAKTLLVRWDGTSWSTASSPDPGGPHSNHLSAIACVSSSDCWAVGHHMATGRARTLALRYVPRSQGCPGEPGPNCPSPTPTESESPLPEISEVAFTPGSATAGQFSDTTRFEARLADASGEPLAGETLTFTLTGEGSHRELTATTGADGIASLAPTLTERPGAHQLTVRFAGDDMRAGSADATVFVVEKEDTALEMQAQGQGNKKTLTARLTDLDSPADGIAGRTIQFYSGSELIGSAETNQDGVAALPIPPPYRGANRTYDAAFTGDDFFLASAATAG